MFKKGSIVLIPFPFTDLSGKKLRPALILSSASVKNDDIIVAFISSQKGKAGAFDMSVKEGEKSFLATGLKISSIIKVSKIATLDKKTCLGELGSIDASIRKEVDKKLKALFGI
ncbi:MAG: type II toxin-antitoxin system PemK/MazF family toxin [Parcubacteria group bacterium]|nr:type II toxin-antitoxin system PemK/MazF family toxin [Parcubacteria group bacterium]